MRFNKLFVMAAVTALLAAGTVPGMAQQRLDPGFEALVDRYLQEVRGVGVDREPDTMSADSFARRVQVSRDLLGELEAIDRGKLAFVQDIDRRFLRSLLETNVIEGERVQRWRQDPRVYLDNKVAYKILADPRPVTHPGRRTRRRPRVAAGAPWQCRDQSRSAHCALGGIILRSH